MAKGAKYQNRHALLQRTPEMLIPRRLQGETMHELPQRTAEMLIARGLQGETMHEPLQRTPEMLIARGLRGEAMQLRGGSGRGLQWMQAVGEAMEPGRQA